MKKLLLLFTLLITTSLAFGQATGYVLPNFASPGSIGTAATTVDVYSRININQTTPSITLTIPKPTNLTTKVTEVWIGNIGTVSLNLRPLPDTSVFSLDTGCAVIIKWVGANYYVVGKGQAFDLSAYMPKSGGTFTGPVNGVTPTELNRVAGVTSNIQTQLNGKEPTIGYTPENVVNKSTDFSVLNNTKYPSTQAVQIRLNDYQFKQFTGYAPTYSTYSQVGNITASDSVQLAISKLDGRMQDGSYYNKDKVYWKMRYMYDKLIRLQASTAEYNGVNTSVPSVFIHGFGDSVGSYKLNYVTNELGKKCTVKNGLVVNFMSSTLTGGAVVHNDVTDCSKWFNGQWIDITGSGSITMSAIGYSNQIQIYYLKGPALGKFQLQLDPGTGTFANEGAEVDCFNATTIGAALTVNKTGDVTQYRARIVQTLGNVTIIQAAFNLISTTTSALHVYNWCVGGLGWNNAILCPTAITNPIFAATQCDFATFEAKEVPSYFAPGGFVANFIDNFNTQQTKVSWCLIGTTPTSSVDDSGTLLSNSNFKEYADLRDFFYYDGHTECKDYASLLDRGLGGDGTHLPLVQIELASHMYDVLGFDNLLCLPFTRNIRSSYVESLKSFTLFGPYYTGNIMSNVLTIQPTAITTSTLSTNPATDYISGGHFFKNRATNALLASVSDVSAASPGLTLTNSFGYSLYTPGHVYYGGAGSSGGNFEYDVIITSTGKHERLSHIGTNAGFPIGSTNLTYRTIAAGSNITAKFLINGGNSVATGGGIGYGAEGLIGVQGDGTRQIATWAINGVDVFQGGDGSGVAMYYKPVSGTLAEAWRINKLGQMGIGTINPSAALHLPVSTSSSGALKFTPIVSLAVTNITSTGTSVSYTFAVQSVFPFYVGQMVTFTGNDPVAYNITAQVTGVNTSSVTVASTATGTFVSGGLASVGGFSTLSTSNYGLMTSDLSKLYFAPALTRYEVGLTTGLTSGTIPVATTDGRLTDATGLTYSSSTLGTPHLTGTGSAPTIAVGAGAGAGATVSVTGTDLGGYITLTTGTPTIPSSEVFTLTFATAYSSAPRVVQLTPANVNSAALSGISSVYADQADITTALFKGTIGAGGLGVSTVYKYYYTVVQ